MHARPPPVPHSHTDPSNPFPHNRPPSSYCAAREALLLVLLLGGALLSARLAPHLAALAARQRAAAARGGGGAPAVGSAALLLLLLLRASGVDYLLAAPLLLQVRARGALQAPPPARPFPHSHSLRLPPLTTTLPPSPPNAQLRLRLARPLQLASLCLMLTALPSVCSAIRAAGRGGGSGGGGPVDIACVAGLAAAAVAATALSLRQLLAAEALLQRAWLVAGGGRDRRD